MENLFSHRRHWFRGKKLFCPLSVISADAEKILAKKSVLWHPNTEAKILASLS